MIRTQTARMPVGRLAVVLALVASLLALAMGSAPARGVAAARTKKVDGTSPYRAVPIKSWRTNGSVYATLIIGNRVYVAGDFSSVTAPHSNNSVPASDLAAFKLSTGALIPSFDADTDGTVWALATDGTHLFVGGDFASVDGTPRANLAAVDAQTGALDTGWTGEASSSVYALATSPTTLYAGGAFNQLDGTARARLGAVSLGDGSLAPWAPSADKSVHAVSVAPDGQSVFVGGWFTAVDGASHSAWFAQVRTSDATVVPTAWTNITAVVLGISVAADGRHVAISQGGLANSGGWWKVAGGQRLWRQGCGGDGQAILATQHWVFTGFHRGCNKSPIGKLDANSIAHHGARDDKFLPYLHPYLGVKALAANAGYLVAGGQITSAAGVPVGGFAIFPAKS